MKINSSKNKSLNKVDAGKNLNVQNTIAEYAFNEILDTAANASSINVEENNKKTREEEIKEFQYYQERMLNDGKMSEVISKRREYGLEIPSAVEDYEKYALDDSESDFAEKLKGRAKKTLIDQATAERNSCTNIIDFLYKEDVWNFKRNEHEVLKTFYGNMDQKQYNEWRLKAEDFVEEWIKQFDKKIEANPNYKPNTIDELAEYKLYNILKNRADFNDLRDQIERTFSYEIRSKYSGNTYDKERSEFNNTNIRTVLQAFGLVSPYGIYINRNDAENDKYQKEYETNIDFLKKEIIIRDIAEQKDMLIRESFDELVKRRKDLGLDNELTKTLEEIKDLKNSPDKDAQKAYSRAIRDLKIDFSDQLLLENYGSDPKIVKLVKGERSFFDKYPSNPEYGITLPISEYEGLRSYIMGVLSRGYAYQDEKSFNEAFDEFQAFRTKNNLPEILGVKEIVANTPGLFLKDNPETRKARKDIKGIMDDHLFMESFGFIDKNKFEKFIEARNYIAVPEAENLYKEPGEYIKWRLETLSSLENIDSFFKKDFSPSWSIGQADKKMISFLDDIVGNKNAPVRDESEKLGNLFESELKDYSSIEWKANPLTKKVLQASGLLYHNLAKVDLKDKSSSQKAFDKYLEDVSKILTDGNVQATKNLFSIKSVANKNNGDLCNLVKLMADGFDPVLKEKNNWSESSLKRFDDIAERVKIKDERKSLGLPKIKELDDLVFRDENILYKAERDSKSPNEIAETQTAEYKKLLDNAKVAFTKQVLAEADGFKDIYKHEYYKKRESFLNADKIIERLQEDYKTRDFIAKNQVLNVSSNFAKEINSGEHNDFLQKIMDIIQEQNPNAAELAKVQYLLEKATKAQQVKEKDIDEPMNIKKTINVADKKAPSENFGINS